MLPSSERLAPVTEDVKEEAAYPPLPVTTPQPAARDPSLLLGLLFWPFALPIFCLTAWLRGTLPKERGMSLRERVNYIRAQRRAEYNLAWRIYIVVLCLIVVAGLGVGVFFAVEAIRRAQKNPTQGDSGADSAWFNP